VCSQHQQEHRWQLVAPRIAECWQGRWASIEYHAPVATTIASGGGEGCNVPSGSTAWGRGAGCWRWNQQDRVPQQFDLGGRRAGVDLVGEECCITISVIHTRETPPFVTTACPHVHAQRAPPGGTQQRIQGVAAVQQTRQQLRGGRGGQSHLRDVTPLGRHHGQHRLSVGAARHSTP
jgi:hypothetical protein